MFRNWLLASVPVALMGATSAHADIIISDFTDAYTLEAGNGSPLSNDASFATADLGGEVDVSITTAAGTESSIQSGFGGGATLLAASQDVGASGSATLSWDGIDGDPSVAVPGLGLDITQGGNDHFEVVVDSLDLAQVTLTVTVFSDDPANGTFNSSTGIIVNGPLPGGSNQIFTADFASLVGAADLTNVAAINLELLAAQNATDISLDLFRINSKGENVSTPGSALLTAAGLALILAGSLIWRTPRQRFPS